MDIVVFLFTVGMIAAIIFSHVQRRNGQWHPHTLSMMRRKTPDGSWQTRPMTEEEKVEDWNARQF